MQISDAEIIAGYVAVAGFAGWIVKFFLGLFKDHVSKQTESLTVLLSEHRSHVNASADKADQTCNALKEITKTLKSINGKSRGKGVRSK